MPSETALDKQVLNVSKIDSQGVGSDGIHLQSSSFSLQLGDQVPFITDEEEVMMRIESRIHQAIKRNILRDTISEDLDWAQCIKNDHDDFLDKIRY